MINIKNGKTNVKIDYRMNCLWLSIILGLGIALILVIPVLIVKLIIGIF